jgi:anti-anti-sigma factor
MCGGSRNRVEADPAMEESTFTLRIHSSNDELVFEVVGRLDQEAEGIFERQLRGCLWDARNAVLLDLSEVSAIDAHGIRALFAVSRLSSALGDRLRIRRSIEPDVERALEESGDLNLLPWEDTSGEPG